MSGYNPDGMVMFQANRRIELLNGASRATGMKGKLNAKDGRNIGHDKRAAPQVQQRRPDREGGLRSNMDKRAQRENDDDAGACNPIGRDGSGGEVSGPIERSPENQGKAPEIQPVVIRQEEWVLALAKAGNSAEMIGQVVGISRFEVIGICDDFKVFVKL